jgi:mRNA deadenylase 3'-5' endonuclease subunit Ccr4
MEELAAFNYFEEVKEKFSVNENPSFGPPLFHRVMRKCHPQGLEHYNVGSSFKIMSYNTTSDRLLEKTATHLSQDDPVHNPIYRMRRILAELEQSCPDILCLQEVSTRTAYPFLTKELEDMGY